MSEDQLFGRALLQSGLSLLYAANVEVVHSHAYDLKALWKRNFDSGYSLRGFDTSTPGRKIRRAARFWGEQTRFLVHQREWKSLAKMPLYETTRSLALLLGGQGHRFPLWLRRAWSQHRAFWNDAHT